MSVHKLSKQQLQARIRQVAHDSERVVFTVHAVQRMNRRAITRAMALSVLTRGHLKREAEPNHSRGSVECRMERHVAGRDIAVVAALSDDDPNIVVVTAIVL